MADTLGFVYMVTNGIHSETDPLFLSSIVCVLYSAPNLAPFNDSTGASQTDGSILGCPA